MVDGLAEVLILVVSLVRKLVAIVDLQVAVNEGLDGLETERTGD